MWSAEWSQFVLQYVFFWKSLTNTKINYSPLSPDRPTLRVGLDFTVLATIKCAKDLLALVLTVTQTLIATLNGYAKVYSPYN